MTLPEILARDLASYRAVAARLAADLDQGPTLDDLDEAERELLAQLATVRARRVARARAEAHAAQAAEIAEWFAEQEQEARRRAAGPDVAESLAAVRALPPFTYQRRPDGSATPPPPAALLEQTGSDR